MKTLTTTSHTATMSTAPILLPGQPLPSNLTKPPAPKCGPGCYEYEGRILANIVGRPKRDGAVVSVVGKEEAAVPDVDAIVGLSPTIRTAKS